MMISAFPSDEWQTKINWSCRTDFLPPHIPLIVDAKQSIIPHSICQFNIKFCQSVTNYQGIRKHAKISQEKASSLFFNYEFCGLVWCFICKFILSLMERHTEENIWKRWLKKYKLEVGYCMSSRKVKGKIFPPDLSSIFL